MELESSLMDEHEEFEEDNRYGILITGPETYVSKASSALNLIKETDPSNWEIVDRNITRITRSGHPGTEIETGRYKTSEKSSTTVGWWAGAIVHEAWHREYYRRDRPYVGEQAEKNCMEKQNEFLEKINHPLIDIEAKLETKYWEIPFEERDW